MLRLLPRSKHALARIVSPCNVGWVKCLRSLSTGPDLSAPVVEECRGMYVTSTRTWAVAKTRRVAPAGALGLTAKAAVQACDAALRAQGHETSLIIHYSDSPSVVAAAVGGGPKATIGLRAMAWTAPTEVDADALDAVSLPPPQPETQEVSIVAVSLPGLSVDTWRTKKSSVPALTDLEGALTTRPPHFLLFVSPSFPLEAFANVLDQAFPVSVKAGGRAFSSSELTSEVASSIRVVQPSEMPTTAAAGSLQVLDLQGGEAGDAPADARFLAAALGARVVMAPVSGAGAGAASDSSGAEAGAEAGAGAGAGAPRPSPRSAPVEVTVGDRGEEDPIAVGVAIAAPKGGSEIGMSEDDFVQLVRHVQGAFWKGGPLSAPKPPTPLPASHFPGDLRASAFYFSDQVVSKLFTPQGVSLTGETPPLSEQARVLDSVGSSEGAVIPLLEIGVLAFPGGAEEFLIFELRYRRLIKSLLEGMRAPRVFGLTAGGVGTLVTLGSYNVMPDGRAHVTVHGGRRFTVVPGTMHMEASEFGLTLGEVRFFDDDAPAETDDAKLKEQVAAAERLCTQLLDDAKALALKAGGTLLFDESIQHSLFHSEGRRGESRAERLSMELAAILPTSYWVRARWLRETSTQIRLEQQMLTLKTSAESIVRSWAVQFYGARGTAGLPTTPRRRKNPDDAGLPRRGF